MNDDYIKIVNVHTYIHVNPTFRSRRRRVEVTTSFFYILPQGTLRELLGPGIRGAGILASESGGDDEEYEGGLLKGEIIPEWVIKYTAVVRDRGVIENKGYFAGAELRQT